MPPARGLGMVAAIVVLVLLSSMAAAITRLTWTQQVTSADDLQGARALQAAYAGTEWGMYQALKGTWTGTNCTGSQTLTLSAPSGFKVTVTCSTQATAFNEGQTQDTTDATGNTMKNSTLWVYVIDAVACNGSASSCPDNASSVGANYVERRRQAVVTSTASGM